MLQRRERPALPPSTPGEHALPGGRIAFRALIAPLALILASCATGTRADLPSTGSASPSATATAAESGAIPTLGTTPPSGLVLPTFFVTLIDSTNGAIGVLTTPGSDCTLSLSAPSGVVSDYPVQRVDANGTTAFAYPAATGHGQSIQAVRCTLGDLASIAMGRVVLP